MQIQLVNIQREVGSEALYITKGELLIIVHDVGRNEDVLVTIITDKANRDIVLSARQGEPIGFERAMTWCAYRRERISKGEYEILGLVGLGVN